MQYMDFQSGYQQFLDLQKYMQWQGAGSSTGGAADYEQYMDYQKEYQQFLKYHSQFIPAVPGLPVHELCHQRHRCRQGRCRRQHHRHHVKDKVEGAAMQGGAAVGGTNAEIMLARWCWRPKASGE